MKHYTSGIYVGPVKRSNGNYDMNLLVVADLSGPIPTLGIGDERLYGTVCGMPHSGKWESDIITLETDTLIAPWVLSKWS
jgi:hypothetical protein